MVIGKGYEDDCLSEGEVHSILEEALRRVPLDGKRVLIIIPDGTRTAPIPLFFRLLFELLSKRVAALDFLVALGTHRKMSEDAINGLLGVTADERTGRYGNVNIFNHRWDVAGTLIQIGTIPASEISHISEGRLSLDIPVTINRNLFNYDQLIVCGPTFPHEVVGFSGGNKYFFPGISGPEVINFTHWLGAVISLTEVIGKKDTPVRAVIDRAAGLIERPKLCLSMVVKGGDLAGLYIGSPEEAYEHAADLSRKVHVVWVDRPFQRVLSIMPAMYDDLWTAAKGMYKMDPAVADGGEIVIFAPHIDELSYSHGSIIDEVGYHVRDYFLAQWDRFVAYPWGVLAHSTHLRGSGTYHTGIEKPRIKVSLATGIPPDRCKRVNLDYIDPNTINLDDWRNREGEGILLVPKAGEMLYRVK